MSDPILCYIRDNWAYFTTKTLTEQTGDDWNDVPYEHNAGSPYDDGCITKIAFELGWETPSDLANGNSRYSVDDINMGAVAWLTDTWDHKGVITAGCPLSEFKKIVLENKGRIYEEVTA